MMNGVVGRLAWERRPLERLGHRIYALLGESTYKRLGRKGRNLELSEKTGPVSTRKAFKALIEDLHAEKEIWLKVETDLGPGEREIIYDGIKSLEVHLEKNGRASLTTISIKDAKGKVLDAETTYVMPEDL